MVCMAGHGRMKALARLLETGGIPDKTSEVVESEKIAIQNIHMQLYDADEANLLEEKDMHVFGCRPLTDPLRLVCCNACKKPIKASHYAAHAERCSLISSTEDTALVRDGDNGHKKPPRKGRRKLQAGKGKEHKKSTSKGEDSAAPSESNLNDHNSTPCSPSGEAQRILDTVDRAAARNASGICIGGKNCSSGVPSPLATKIYYSQGSHRLRIALGHLYQKMSPKEHGHDSVCAEVKQDKTMLSSQAPYLSKALHETHKDGVTQMKIPRIVLHTLDKYHDLRWINSRLFKTIPREWLCDTIAPGSVTLLKNNYHSTSYTYPRNSGSSLTTTRQASGSVPVVYLPEHGGS